MADGSAGARPATAVRTVLGAAAVLAVVLVAAFVLAGACAPASELLRPPVAIGVTTDSPELSYQDPLTGQRSGFDITFVQWLGTNADLPFTPQFIDLIVGAREEQLVLGGDAGGVDLVAASYTITSQRERLVDFAGPYLQSQQGVLVRASEERVLTNPSQLAGRSVCAQRGSTSVAELRQIRGVIVREEVGLLQCVTALRAGQVDAVSTDELLLRGYARSDPELRIEAGVVFGSLQQYGIGLSPRDGTADCEAMNGYLAQFVASGAWDAAFTNNFGPDLDRDRFRPNPRACVDDAESG